MGHSEAWADTGQRRRARHYLMMGLVLLAGTSLSFLLFRSVRKVEQVKLEADFQRVALDHRSAIVAAFHDKMILLQSAGAFCSAAGGVTPSDFTKFTTPLLRSVRGVHALKWIPRVADSERCTYEVAAEIDGFDGFLITECAGDGTLAKAARRDVYFPVCCVGLCGGREIVSGFDLASEPNRKAALDKARDTGQMAGTAQIPLVQERGRQSAVLVFNPVYAKGALDNTVEERRQNLAGYVLGAFKIGEIVEDALTRLQPEGVDITVFDETSPAEKKLLCFHASCTRKAPIQERAQPVMKAPQGLAQRASVELAGRQWSVLCTPAPAFYDRYHTRSPWYVLGGSMALTLTMTSFFGGYVRRNVRTERLLEALRASQRMTEEIINAIPVRVFWKDRNLVYLGCNAAFARDAGFAVPKDIIGKDDFQMGWRDRAELYRGDDRQVIESGRAKLLIEEPMTNAEGKTVTLLTSKIPLRGPNDEIVGVLGTYMDITERKRAEIEFRQERAKLEMATENLSVGLHIISKDYRVLWSNKVMRSRYGRMEGLHCYEVIHKAGGVCAGCVARKVLETGCEKISHEKSALMPDGKTEWSEVIVTPVRDDLGNLVAALEMIVPITERKRAELDRQQMEVRLRQQQKLESIGTLAGGVAHEINNPINGIMNYAQLISEGLPADHPLHEYAAEIMAETDRVAGIVRNLLAFARQEQQGHSPARIKDIVDATLSLIRTVIRHDNIVLEVDVPEELPLIKCRSQQIEQVIMNLVTNARDALNEKYPGSDPAKRLRITARGLCRYGRHWVRTTVEDTGTGIPKDVLRRIFDPFFTTKARDRGTGLGLAISHGIIQEHGGAITVETEVGQYTRMHVDLPLVNGAMSSGKGEES